jgi:hypothetical protein
MPRLNFSTSGGRSEAKMGGLNAEVAVRAIVIMAAGLLLSGCASYEYDLTQPPALARHIGTARQTSVQYDPLIYQLQTYDNCLVIWIANPTRDSILLVGERSVVVDPSNQSYPVRGQTIAPGSFIKLVLPPLREAVYDEPAYYGGGPVFYGRFHHGGYVWVGPDYYYYGPTVYDYPLFDWPADTGVRLTFTFERKGKRFEQTLTFLRKRVG